MDNNQNGKGEKGTPPAVEEKKLDILDEIKASESMIRKVLLIKSLSQIKEMAHNILELKEKCNALLGAIGIPEADIKRIIDFVNNLPTVQLSEVDKKKVDDWAKDEISGRKKTIEKKLEDNAGTGLPWNILNLANGHNLVHDSDMRFRGMGGTTGDIVPPSQVYITSQDSANSMVLCSANGNKLEVTI